MASGEERIKVDLAGFQRDPMKLANCSVYPDGSVGVFWKINGEETEEDKMAGMVVETMPGKPLIRLLAIAPVRNTFDFNPVDPIAGVDPATFITVGSREGEPDRPPGMSPFNVFFDNPAKRPFETFAAKLTLKRLKVTGANGRVTVTVGDVKAGPFTGEIQITVYNGSPLIHVETVLKTDEPNRAFVYDTGLVSADPKWKTLTWTDTEGHLKTEPFHANLVDKPRSVRHRAIVAEGTTYSVACFPLPHQYFFPRDYTDNLSFTWAGKNHRGLEPRAGFGIRQTERGGGNYSPWFSAPPGTEQRLGVFYLVSIGNAEDAIKKTLRYTRNDRFPEIPGYKTFTSHWHMAITMAALAEKAKGGKRSVPDFVKMFRDMGVNIVHLAEFHGDGHPRDPGPVRLKELDAMFHECRQLSDDSMLFLPGEEANVHLGPSKKGNAGHWLYLFPKPVRWTMVRGKDQPFSEEIPDVGTVYHTGNREDMARLIEQEHGLAWTAHARIKASTWAPDIYRDEEFFKSSSFLGAAWKAMPADLSRPKLGERTFNLLDDMSNWGRKKQLLGEVDVFKLDHTHELYGAMNINYVQLDHVPKFDEGWQPLLNSLRAGKFFVTTGEILLRDFKINGKTSGQTLELAADGKAELTIALNWTFPLAYAEIVSGDGATVFRERIDLSDTNQFGEKSWTRALKLRGRSWVRVEAWDIAKNGTFSQPIWIEKK